MSTSELLVRINDVLTNKIIEQILLDSKQSSQIDVQIGKFIYDNHQNIKNLVKHIITVSIKYNNLESLLEPHREVILEYIYYFIKCHPNKNCDYEKEFNIKDLEE
jgi:hypothetical protein